MSVRMTCETCANSPVGLCSLHASAPDLLAALKAVAELDEWGKVTPDLLRQIDAAIRKAEGAS